MARTDDYVIILALLGLGYAVVSTPLLRKAVVDPIVETAVVRSRTVLPVTSGIMGLLSTRRRRTIWTRSRYTLG